MPLKDLSPILTRAGITQGEFAWACGVSRVTVNKWAKGKPVHAWMESHAANTLAAINAAALKGSLPFDALEGTERTVAHGRVRPRLKDVIARFA